MQQVTETVDGQDYSFSYSYDQLGRTNQVTYPSGFAITKHYNDKGYLNEIKRADGNNTQSIWELNQMNYRGQIENTTLGNGLTTTYEYTDDFHVLEGIETSNNIQNYLCNFNPETGNLTNRTINNTVESFLYDELNRLTDILETKDIIANKGGFVLAHWDGTTETEEKIKTETKATIRCIPVDAVEEEGKCIFSGKPSNKRVLFAKAY